MDAKLLKKIEQKYIKREIDVRPGDTARVQLKIIEGGKERTQVFEGIVIAVNNSGLRKTITVRKIASGVGVEKIFPLSSPIVKKIDIVDRGHIRRSKLYYMRAKVGKRAMDVGKKDGFVAIEEDEMKKEAAKEVPVDEKSAKPKGSSKEGEPREEVSASKEADADIKKEKQDEIKKDLKKESKDKKPEKAAEHKADVEDKTSKAATKATK